MRFVYIDEAGTSQQEPVTIVAGLIIDADNQLMSAEAAVCEALGAVPPQLSDGFVFHAKDVWSNKGYRDHWRMSDRLAFLKNMMALPRRLGIPIAYGIHRRGFDWKGPIDFKGIGMSPAQLDHLMSFTGCIARADKYIRENAGTSEIASVVAEDIPEMRRFLKITPKVLKENPMILPTGNDMIRPTLAEKKAGYIAQETEMRVSRIRNNVHFVGKSDDVVMYLADACAYGLRRYFSDQTHGVDFVSAIFGFEPIKEDYAGYATYGCFDPLGRRRRPS